MRRGLLRRVVQHVLGNGARLFHQRRIFQIGIAQQRQAALPRADEFAGAAQAQVLAGDFETVAWFRK